MTIDFTTGELILFLYPWLLLVFYLGGKWGGYVTFKAVGKDMDVLQRIAKRQAAVIKFWEERALGPEPEEFESREGKEAVN